MDVEQLSKHRVEKKRFSRLKAREQARKAIKLAVNQSTEGSANTPQKRFLAHSVTYEPDEGALLPQVKKISVVSELPDKSETRIIPQSTKDQDTYTIEHEGEKILMSGTLKIVDANDELLYDTDPEAVLLHPIIQKLPKHHEKVPKKEADVHRVDESLEKKLTVTQDDRDSIPVRLHKTAQTSFEERLKQNLLENQQGLSSDSTGNEISDTHITKQTGEVAHIQEEEIEARREVKAHKKGEFFLLKATIFIIVMILLSSFSLILESHWEYTRVTQSDTAQIHTKFFANPDNLLSKIHFK